MPDILASRIVNGWTDLQDFELTTVGSDTTFRFSCRSGDHVIWFRWQSIFEKRPDIRDVWQLGDGDWFLVTSRILDLPSWFELHSLEVSGPRAYEMIQKLNDGYKPSEPITGAHIWRILSGDRLTWSGKSRPDSNAPQGLRRVFDFRENALVVAYFESRSDPLTWGDIEETPEGAAIGIEALRTVASLGIPRVFAADPQWSME